MLTIGDKFPDFSVTGVVSTNPADAFKPFTQDSDAGKWKLVFFWPKDFTFVCPTEIAGFGKLNGDFNDRDTVVDCLLRSVVLSGRRDREREQ